MRVRTHTNPFNYYERIKRINIAEIFPKCSLEKIDIEIGFGKGIFIRNWAKNHPERCVIGAEIRANIVQILQKKIQKEDVQNIHLYHGNGEILVDDGFEDQSIDNIFIFHPDPWFKKKHHKRRVINSKFIKIIQKKLKQTGFLRLSTDVEDLFEDMIETISTIPELILITNDPFWETEYTTHWQEYSNLDNRHTFSATFTKS